MKNLCILGSTGSIGVSTLKVVAQFPDKFRVRSMTARPTAIPPETLSPRRATALLVLVEPADDQLFDGPRGFDFVVAFDRELDDGAVRGGEEQDAEDRFAVDFLVLPAAIRFLLSPESDHLSGVNLPVTAGSAI